MEDFEPAIGRRLRPLDTNRSGQFKMPKNEVIILSLSFFIMFFFFHFPFSTLLCHNLFSFPFPFSVFPSSPLFAAVFAEAASPLALNAAKYEHINHAHRSLFLPSCLPLLLLLLILRCPHRQQFILFGRDLCRSLLRLSSDVPWNQPKPPKRKANEIR